MALPDWVRFRLLYIEYLFWAGLGGGGAAIAAALSASHALTRETWLVALGLSLAMVLARMKDNPREVWEDNYREHERQRRLAALAQKQDIAVEAVKEVSEKLAEVKDNEAEP